MSENATISQMEKEVQEMTALRYLTKENAVFSKTEGGFLSLEYNGQFWNRVQVIRLFPFTEPEKFISIRTVEERSREIGVVKDLKDMEKEKSLPFARRAIKLMRQRTYQEKPTPLWKKAAVTLFSSLLV